MQVKSLDTAVLSRLIDLTQVASKFFVIGIIV